MFIFHWLSYTERHPVPKSTEDVFQELYEALVHPQGQYPDDASYRWIYDRERRLSDRPDLLAVIYQGLVQRINKTGMDQHVYNKDNRIYHHPSPNSTYTYDLSSAVKAFKVSGLLSWMDLKPFLDSDPKSLIWKAPEVKVSVKKESESTPKQDVDMSSE